MSQQCRGPVFAFLWKDFGKSYFDVHPSQKHLPHALQVNFPLLLVALLHL